MASTKLPLLCAATLLLLATSARGGDIVVTGDRPDPCEADPWCTSGTYEDALALTTGSDVNPFGDPVGDGGGSDGGPEIVVERDREAKDQENKDDECAEQASNGAFLAGGGAPTSDVVAHGEVHDDELMRGDDEELTNRERQEDLIRRAQADGSRVCLGLEIGRGTLPNGSQEAMYDFADANGIPVFNMDTTQAAGATSSTCNNDVYDPLSTSYNEQQATSCLNDRDQGMFGAIAAALAFGVNGQPCDRVVAIAGDAHTSQTISSEHVGTNPYDRVTLVDLLNGFGIDTFVDNRAMYEDECTE